MFMRQPVPAGHVRPASAVAETASRGIARAALVHLPVSLLVKAPDTVAVRSARPSAQQVVARLAAIGSFHVFGHVQFRVGFERLQYRLTRSSRGAKRRRVLRRQILPHRVDRAANLTSNGSQALALLVQYPDLHVSLVRDHSCSKRPFIPSSRCINSLVPTVYQFTGADDTLALF